MLLYHYQHEPSAQNYFIILQQSSLPAGVFSSQQSLHCCKAHFFLCYTDATAMATDLQACFDPPNPRHHTTTSASIRKHFSMIRRTNMVRRVLIAPDRQAGGHRGLARRRYLAAWQRGEETSLRSCGSGHDEGGRSAGYEERRVMALALACLSKSPTPSRDSLACMIG